MIQIFLSCFPQNFHVLHCGIIHFFVFKWIFFQPSWWFLQCLFQASLCRVIKSFQQSVFWCWGGTLLIAFCLFFFFLILGGDGLYQWKPRNNEVLIAWVLSVSEHLLHWEFSCSAERFVCMLAVLLYIQQMWGFGNEAVGIWGSYFYYWRDLRMVLLGLCNHNATGLCCIQVSSPVLELCCWG